MTAGTVEHRLSVILKNITNRRNISSSSVGTMIPTPGMSHSGNAKSVNSCSGDSSMVATSSTGMDGQPAKNAGNLLTATNGLTGVRHNASLNASDGSLLARYQQSPANVTLGSVGNNIMPSIGMSRQMSQMIPTPGLGNSHSLSVIADPSNEVGFSTMESTIASQNLQQKQYAGSQNSRMNSLGGQIGVGSRPNMQQKSSPYGFSNGVANGNSGLIGNNVHFGNGPVVSEGYLNTASYGSYSKPLHQQFDQLHHQPMSQVNTAGISVHEMNNQNLNPMSLQSKPKTNHALLTHNSSMHQIQQLPQVNSQTYDNYQSPQSTRENLLQPQHQVQNFQQQSNQPYGHLVRHQHQHHHQQQQQQQQLAPKTSDLRQCSITSSCRGQLALEYDSESHNEPLFPQSAQQFQLSQLESQYHQNTPMFNLSKTGQLLDHCGTQDSKPTVSQGSEDTFHLRQQPTESQNDYGIPLSGSQQSNALQRGLWHPQPLQKPHLLENLSYEHNIKEEFQQRVVGQEEAQQPHFKGCNTGPASATQVLARQSSNEMASTPPNDIRARNYYNQLRWLLLLFHARWCSSPQGTCKEKNCLKVQQLVMHMRNCSSDQCSFPRCLGSKRLVQHFQTCQEPNCPVCVRLRKFVASESERKAQRCPFPGYQSSESCRAINPVRADGMINKTRTLQLETSEGPESSKRMKLQHMVTPVAPKRESSPVCVPTISQPHACQEVQPQLADVMISTLSDASELKRKVGMGSVQGNLLSFASVEDENILTAKSAVEPLLPNDVVGHAKKEAMLVEQSSNHIKIEMKEEAKSPIADAIAGSKSGKPKIKGVSLTELFTPEQIREHIRSLRQWTGQSKARAEKNQAMEHSMSENSCQLCAVEKLTFEPPPIYCTPCGARIKRNVTYYTMGTGDTRHYFCVPCYNEARGETIDVEGSAYPKAKLEKKKNDEDTEEWWVQCDKCEAWQHQICALFNGRRNDGGQAEYTCPNCYIEEIEKGERKPLPQSAVLGAKDLPRTILSDQIEQRLFRRLKQERHERARHQGKSFDEVPGAEALVVRVVSSVDKKLEVKQRFLEIFQEDNYPTEFPYKSKVVLLFQKIEGVEVCLFGMYVQEFGSECQFPNQRRVYLSYLDSVKYFRPEIRTVSGEALRTFVYHEILIGYLEYCKKRGFTSCYIWACPPLKGEDYILYCHPEIQKTPKSDKLREWYLSMLRKATKENIVVELTNLYDHFFVSHGDCKAKVTAARLPYFDGDYWPGAAEDMINQLRQEEDGRNQNKKGKTKKTLTKRALKAAGQTDLTGNASKDALLMQKLGDTICPMKEDFIMVHLQHACSHCYVLMSSGSRWVCNQCKNFQLCDRCHYAEQRLEERERHPINSREKHVFRPIQITDVPSDTKDKDEILESEFFDTRQAFLSLCQGNHYQYDTLRRAKHSSIMVLYHLHNPTAPAFVTTCNTCLHDIETGLGWRCEICPDFDICNACYQKDGGVDHPHKLTNHPSIADRDAQNQEARQKRVLQLRKMLDLLVHASQCRFPHCQYPNCRKVKGLFRHGIQCKTRASGGCPLCKKMWYLLQLHSRACKESDCHVPRCKDLKEHLKRLQQQSDSRRRAAVMEMMRQRAAEYAGNSD